jgi:hypothetical protein
VRVAVANPKFGQNIKRLPRSRDAPSCPVDLAKPRLALVWHKYQRFGGTTKSGLGFGGAASPSSRNRAVPIGPEIGHFLKL